MTIRRAVWAAAALTATTTLAGAADLAPLVRKAPAPEPMPQVSGYIEMYTGWGQTKDTVEFCESGFGCGSDTEKFNSWVLGGAGRANVWLPGNMSLQLDAQAEGNSYKFSGDGDDDDRFSNHSYLIGVHLNWRDPQRGLFGAFVGAGDAGGGFSPATRHIVGGLEGQWYWNQFTFYAQGGYDTSIGGMGFSDDGSADAWFARATVRYFFTPNLLLEATGLYANGDLDFGNDGGMIIGPFSDSVGFQTWIWQAKLEWRPGTAPFSIFAKYQGSQTEYDTISFFGDSFSAKTTDHRIMGGIRLFLGENSLQAGTRNGTTLDIIDPFSNATSPLMAPPSGGLPL